MAERSILSLLVWMAETALIIKQARNFVHLANRGDRGGMDELDIMRGGCREVRVAQHGFRGHRAVHVRKGSNLQSP